MLHCVSRRAFGKTMEFIYACLLPYTQRIQGEWFQFGVERCFYRQALTTRAERFPLAVFTWPQHRQQVRISIISRRECNLWPLCTHIICSLQIVRVAANLSEPNSPNTSKLQRDSSLQTPARNKLAQPQAWEQL